jgi:O-acetyl-ADP-ribose deacetylase
LLEELHRFPSCATGQAVLTKGYRLPAKYVIHAVGPMWYDGQRGEPALLESAYESSFARAKGQADIHTIAFPAISTGIYGYPKEAAAAIALSVMRRHETEFAEIIACLFDESSFALYTERANPQRKSV